jgi:flagellar hook-basal body complex protein FliE
VVERIAAYNNVSVKCQTNPVYQQTHEENYVVKIGERYINKYQPRPRNANNYHDDEEHQLPMISLRTDNCISFSKYLKNSYTSASQKHHSRRNVQKKIVQRDDALVDEIICWKQTHGFKFRYQMIHIVLTSEIPFYAICLVVIFDCVRNIISISNKT